MASRTSLMDEINDAEELRELVKSLNLLVVAAVVSGDRELWRETEAILNRCELHLKAVDNE